MSKVIFEYILPEDQEEVNIVFRSTKLLIALSEIGQQIFRPYRKHGYGMDMAELNELRDKCPEIDDAIELLEKKYWEILTEYDINDII